MKKRMLCLGLAVCMLLSGCVKQEPEQTQSNTTLPTQTSPATTAPTETTAPEETTVPVETTAPTEYIGLTVDQDNESISTYEESFTVSGTSDPAEAVRINDVQVPQNADGSFTYDVPLVPGENLITLTHKEETVTYSVHRRYCVQAYSPEEGRAYGSGATVFLRVFAREGSEVTALFDGETVTMKKTVDQLGSGAAEGFLLYTGQFYLPENNEADKNMGQVVFTVTCDGITETYSSADIICNAKVPYRFQDSEATPEGYRNVGSGYIVEVVDQSVETFYGYGNDDYSNPTYNYLPKGTVDYGYYETITSDSGEQTYKLLRCGVRVYYKIKNTPNTIQSQAVDCYYGYLPNENQIDVASIVIEGHHTYLTVDTLWKAPFFFDFEEQAYKDPYTRDFRVERFNASYVDIRFCYATEVGGNIEIPGDHPLFSHAEWIDNGSDHTLRLHLKVAGGFYGWDAFYNDNDQLVFQFLNPVLVQKADNAYGADLTGTRIMIDVGHGRGDTGAFGLDSLGLGWIESERNLNLAYMLKEELESMGATVIMNRASQEELLTQRERICFLKQESPDYCIAIHHNSGGADKERSGFEAGYFTTWSQLATDHIHYAAKASGVYDSSLVMWFYYYVNRQTNCPQVLTECGFMTNTEDFNKIINEEANRQKAISMAQGIANYFLEITEMNTQ